MTIIHITYSRLILFSIINSVKELSCLSLIISENILFYYFLVKINFTKNKELSIKSIRFKKYESYFVNFLNLLILSLFIIMPISFILKTFKSIFSYNNIFKLLFKLLNNILFHKNKKYILFLDILILCIS